jgi:putative membrane protein
MIGNNSSQDTPRVSPFVLIAKGFCMGTADVIPGVSGGTMALILGIYSRFINAIKSFDLVWLKGTVKLDPRIIFGRPDFVFIIPLLIGIVAALFFFTRIISLPRLIETYPEPVYGLFFGLIAGSIIILVQKMDTLSFSGFMYLALGTIFGLIVFNLVPLNTPETGWFVFVSGTLAICAMMLPGISGSFILLILRKYSYIFNAIGYLDLSILVPFILGILTGLVLFSRLLAWLLYKYYVQTILMIIGILVASLWVIWPFQNRVFETINNKQLLISTSPYIPDNFVSNVQLALLMVTIGFVSVIMINIVANRISHSGV